MRGTWKNQIEIDRKEWDKLVDKTPEVSIYVCSFYLDATAIDWEAYVAEDNSFAIPVGIVKKGGLKRVYPPLFQGFLEPIGATDKIDWTEFEKALKERYSKVDIHLKSSYLSQTDYRKYIFQSVSQEEFKLKTQAKRKIKAFDKTNYQIREKNINTEALAQLVVEELSKKIPLFATKSVQHLYDLIHAAEKNNFLYKVGVYSGTELKGGLIGLQYKNELVYLKGAVHQELQKHGAMYALMNHFINYGFAQNCEINFGGSRVEGVRFFYQRFNGKDVDYFHYYWDHSPYWFKILYSLYSKIKK